MIRMYAMARAKCILVLANPEMVPELQVRNHYVRHFYPHRLARPFLYRRHAHGIEIWRGPELLGHNINEAAARLCDLTLAEGGGITLQAEAPAGQPSVSPEAG